MNKERYATREANTGHALNELEVAIKEAKRVNDEGGKFDTDLIQSAIDILESVTMEDFAAVPVPQTKFELELLIVEIVYEILGNMRLIHVDTLKYLKEQQKLGILQRNDDAAETMLLQEYPEEDD